MSNFGLNSKASIQSTVRDQFVLDFFSHERTFLVGYPTVWQVSDEFVPVFRQVL